MGGCFRQRGRLSSHDEFDGLHEWMNAIRGIQMKCTWNSIFHWLPLNFDLFYNSS